MKHTFITIFISIFLLTTTHAQLPPVPDPDFGIQGSVLLNLDWIEEYATAVAIQPWDGKILVGVITVEPSRTNSVLIRLNPDGSLDKQFAQEGIQPGFFPTVSNRLVSVLVQEDHKILLSGNAGDQSIPNTTDFVVARLLEDGTPDPNFGQDGLVTIDVDGWDDLGGYMLLSPLDNKILIAGVSFNGFTSHSTVARLIPSGMPDNSFDSDGKLSVLIGDSPFSGLDKIVMQADKILTMGWASSGTSRPIALARFTEAGEIDNTFGSNGTFFIDPHPTLGAVGSALSVSPAGKIIVVGIVPYLSSQDGGGMYLTCLHANGSIDSGFGPYGTGYVFNNDCCFFNAPKILFQADQKIIVGGSQSFGIGLSRFSSAGIPDSSFGYNGAYRGKYEGTVTRGSVNDMVLQEDGRLLVAGGTGDIGIGHKGPAIARYDLGALTGTQQIESTMPSISLFPNPTFDYVELDYDLQDADALSFSLVDFSGRQVLAFMEKAARDPGKHVEKLMLTEKITAGIYCLKVTGSGWIQYVRMIKR